MSRTWKDRKGYKTKQHYPSYTTMNYQNRIRGGYEDYDHSDEELYVYDQSCENCCYFGGNVIDIAASLEEMGAAAVGINCSCGPDQLECIVRNLRERVNIPVIVKPNAGLPVINEKGEAVYPMEPEVFGEHMKKLVQLGAGIVGGCCGTDGRFIRELRKIV